MSFLEESRGPKRVRPTLSTEDDATLFAPRTLVTEQEVAMLYRESGPTGDRKQPKLSLNSCTMQNMGDILKRRVPCIEWLPKYSLRDNLKSDVIAGATVGFVLIAQGISYALLADLPAAYGLYACLAAPIVYALMGTSVQLQIGPFALISLLISNTVSATVDPDDNPEKYTEAVLVVSVLSGALMLLMGLFRLGVLVNFLAKPVISGLTTGGAFLIMTSQMSKFVGVDIPRGSFFATWVEIFKRVSEINVASFLIGFISLFILTVHREVKKTRFGRKLRLGHQPMQLYVLIVGTIASQFGGFEANYGVKVLGFVPAGLPPMHVPQAFDLTSDLLVPTLVISLVGYALSMATSKTFAEKNGYEVNANQELFALGMANLIGGFAMGYPAFSSLSRSALVHECGAKTSLHNLFSAAVVIIVLAFLTPFLEAMPYPCLAAIIFDSLNSLFRQVSEPFLLWKHDGRDMLIWIVTFISVLVLEVAYGLFIGIGFSFICLLITINNTPYAVLGRFPKLPWLFKDIHRFSDAEHVPGILIFRFDSALNFVNCENFRVNLMRQVAMRQTQCANVGSTLHSVVLDASSISDCDSTAMCALVKVYKELQSDNIELILCSCRGGFRDILRRSSLTFQEYVSIQGAVAYAHGKVPVSPGTSPRASVKQQHSQLFRARLASNDSNSSETSTVLGSVVVAVDYDNDDDDVQHDSSPYVNRMSLASSSDDSEQSDSKTGSSNTFVELAPM